MVENSPVKFVKKFVKYVKHSGSEENYPEDRIYVNMTIAVYRLFKEWDSVKNDEKLRAEFIKRFNHDKKMIEKLEYIQ